jgi:HSP20 family molecular chaperone IbpA
MHYVDYKKVKDGIFSEIERVFNEVSTLPLYSPNRKLKGHPLLDVIKSDDSLIVQYVVPGVKLEDLNVEVTKDDQGKLLKVSGKLSSDYSYKDPDYQIRELSSREFTRAILLPEDVLDEEPIATLKDGVLKLVFKTTLKIEPEVSIKKIKIKSE